MKHLKISYEERQKDLQTQHDDAAITELHISLKQKEDDNVVLMTKLKSTRLKDKSYCELNQHLEQDKDNLALELCQNNDIINSLHQ